MTRRQNRWALIMPALAALTFASEAAAASITDPAGDFLTTYVGPENADLDLLSARVDFDGTNFTLRATTSGTVGTTPGSLYVLWVNRGSGIARFGAAAPDILFDAVGVFRPAGPDLVADLAGVPPGAPKLTFLSADAFSFDGSSLTGVLPLSLLASTGFAPADYRFTLATRIGDTDFNQVADLAPDDGMFEAVPEPAAIGLLLGGVGLLGWARRGGRSGAGRLPSVPPPTRGR